MPADHQASGLQRLFSQPVAAQVISVMVPVTAPEYSGLAACIAQEFSRQGRNVLHVDTRPSPSTWLPLFKWQPAKSLNQQMIRADSHWLLHAPDAKGGERAIVTAASRQHPEIDLLVFGELPYAPQGCALEMATPQALVLLADVPDLATAYAHIKGLHQCRSTQDCVVAGAGAERLAQAARRFLKMPLYIAKQSEQVWHLRDAGPQTSSNTLSGCPDLAGYVARILGRRSQEAERTTSYAS